MYALHESPIIRESVVEFQKKNPNVKIDYQIAMLDDDTGEMTGDYVKVLNTKLLAGDGPDIIVMDDLNINTYKVEDKIYAVPTRIQIPIKAGTDEGMASAVTLSKLVELREKTNKVIFSGISKDIACYLFTIG